MNFTLFSFNFLDPLYKDYLNNGRSWNYFEQKQKYFEEMGLDSEGSFYNLFTLILIFFIMAMVHLVNLLIFTKWLKKKEKWGKISKWIFKLFTFAIYIRIIIQSYQYFLITSWSEIRDFDYSSLSRIISLIISILILSLWLFIFVFLIILWTKGVNSNTKGAWKYFIELFSGFKLSNKARLFTVLEIFKKLFLVSFLIFLR